MQTAKPAGFNSPQLAALGYNLPSHDTPRLAAGQFIASAVTAGGCSSGSASCLAGLEPVQDSCTAVSGTILRTLDKRRQR